MGPLGGEAEVLDRLVAERNDATLAEYADLFASRTGQRTGTPALCRALKRLGWVRKRRRSGPASRVVWTCQRAGWRGETKPPTPAPGGSFPSTRAASTRA